MEEQDNSREESTPMQYAVEMGVTGGRGYELDRAIRNPFFCYWQDDSAITVQVDLLNRDIRDGKSYLNAYPDERYHSGMWDPIQDIQLRLGELNTDVCPYIIANADYFKIALGSIMSGKYIADDPASWVPGDSTYKY